MDQVSFAADPPDQCLLGFFRRSFGLLLVGPKLPVLFVAVLKDGRMMISLGSTDPVDQSQN